MRVTSDGYSIKFDRGTAERLIHNADAALTNEHLTRQRVERLENVLGRNLLGRIRWLLTGK